MGLGCVVTESGLSRAYKPPLVELMDKPLKLQHLNLQPYDPELRQSGFINDVTAGFRV